MATLAGEPICVLDLETAKSADDCRYCGDPETAHLGVSGPHEQGRRCYATGQDGKPVSWFVPLGWDNKPALGLSIGCFYAYADTRCHFFDMPALEETMRHFVETRPLLVSFNGIGFAFPLMRGLLRQRAELETAECPLWRDGLGQLCDAFEALCTTSYDILAEICKVDPARTFARGLNSLDAISRANGYGGTLSHRARAPRLWAKGEYARVLNCCQDDVLTTKALFEQIIETGVLKRGDGMPIALAGPNLAGLAGP